MPTTTQHIPQDLVEKALELTGKSIESMNAIDYITYLDDEQFLEEWLFDFSIEKFYYYLLSPWFIEKYVPIAVRKFYMWDYDPDYDENPEELSINYFWQACNSYQKGNATQLIQLLSNI